jgi:ferredoxin-NADP reductase
VLYLTGRTTILIGDKAAAYLPHTKLAVKIDVEEARYVKDGLAFRGSVIDYSPYNPPVRRLVTEQDQAVPEAGSSALATATLLKREEITPSISRFVFRLSPSVDKKGVKKPLETWQPGQHVTLDFGPELDHGWGHMRDDDPQSLNDDFVRTFTVSAPLDADAVDDKGQLKDGVEPELEITMRKHGPATGLLWKWHLRVPLELPVLGFGGSSEFRLPVGVLGQSEVEESVFVAGGVGITPLMAQAKNVLAAEGSGALKVLWSLRGEDLPLAVKVLGNTKGLGEATKVFVTGTMDGEANEAMASLAQLGCQVSGGRMDRADVLGVGEQGKRRFYCCTGPEMMKALLAWTEGEKVVFESFEY